MDDVTTTTCGAENSKVNDGNKVGKSRENVQNFARTQLYVRSSASNYVLGIDI